MFRHPFFILLFVALVAVSVLHNLGLLFFWYGQFAPLDLIVHFLGGFWVGGMTLWAFFIRTNDGGQKTATRLFWVPLGVILLVGAGWEVFEFIIREPLSFITKEKYILDTTTDFIADISGGAGASWYFIHKKYI